MSMCKIICVTNRHLAGDHLIQQIETIANSGVDGIILREKDLKESEYESLARQVKKICDDAGLPLYLHTYRDVAKRLGITRLHLPLSQFLQMTAEEKKEFTEIGVSTHSPEEAEKAQQAGAAYVTAGHVFATDCKKGLAPRGIFFLENVCNSVQIPVYAIGGISPENADSCIKAGASGICLMSSLMVAEKQEVVQIVRSLFSAQPAQILLPKQDV